MRPQPSVRDASGISAAETELAAPNSVLVQGGSGVGDAGFKTVETTEATAEFFVFFVFLTFKKSENSPFLFSLARKESKVTLSRAASTSSYHIARVRPGHIILHIPSHA